MTTARTPRYDLCGAAHDYPAWEGAPQRSILICSYPRSGSTMLGEALYFAGGLGCALEYLHAGFRGGFEHRWNVRGLGPLVERVRRHRTAPNGTLAIKLFWRDVLDLVREVDPDAFPHERDTPAEAIPPQSYRTLNALLCACFPNPTHIHLNRRDHLRQAVSCVVATQTDVWRRIPGVEGEAQPAPLSYDFDAIMDMVAGQAFTQAHWQAFFAANGIDPYPVAYEELVAEYAPVVERLLHALGQPAPAPAIRMARQSTAQNEALMRRFLQDPRTIARR